MLRAETATAPEYRRADGSADALVALNVSRPAALEPRQQLWCNIRGLQRQ
jgi:hypothetical protein